MDNLGKAYGQLPTVSTPFQRQRIGSLYPDGSFFLEREKRDILFPSIGSPLRYQPTHMPKVEPQDLGPHIIIERGVMYQYSIWEN